MGSPAVTAAGTARGFGSSVPSERERLKGSEGDERREAKRSTGVTACCPGSRGRVKLTGRKGSSLDFHSLGAFFVCTRPPERLHWKWDGTVNPGTAEMPIHSVGHGAILREYRVVASFITKDHPFARSREGVGDIVPDSFGDHSSSLAVVCLGLARLLGCVRVVMEPSSAAPVPRPDLFSAAAPVALADRLHVPAATRRHPE